MESHREGNSCPQCRVTSPGGARNNQGLQAKNGEFQETTKLQPKNLLSRGGGVVVPSVQHFQVHICPTTGGEIQLTIPVQTTVEELKTVIARKLKLPIDRINLLYKERILKSGALMQHGVVDGCKFTLLPNVETGLSTPKADHHSIMQVLENLSDRQVNEFLAGKAPLTLAMRVGEHMMFVQLQLSSSPFAMNKQTASNHNQNGSSSQQFPNPIHRQPTTTTSSSTSRKQQHHPHRHLHPIQPLPNNRHYHPYHQVPPQTTSSILHPQHHHYHNRGHYPGLPTKPSEEAGMPPQTTLHTPAQQRMVDMLKDGASSSAASSVSCSAPSSSGSSSMPHDARNDHLKDLLLQSSTSSNQDDQEHHLDIPKGFRSPPTPTRILSSPFASPVSPVSSGYDTSSPMSDCSLPSSPEATTPDASFSASASQLNYEQQQHHHHSQCPTTRQQRKSKPVRLFIPPEMEGGQHVVVGEKLQDLRGVASSSTCNTDLQSNGHDNKTQSEPAVDPNQQGSSKGAVIDSMYHMGRGIYSGTFSGTLNPTLQDTSGRPKRSLGTIVHILNDLLGAAPKGKIQVDSFSTGAAHTQQVWNHGNARPRGQHRVSGIRPLCGHAGCPERSHTQPMRRQHHQSQEDFKRLEKENKVMKDKVELVQMMLQQRRQRRKARREARSSPYTWQLESGGDNTTEGSRMKLLAMNKNSLQEVNVDSSCKTSESDARETSEHDAAFTSDLKAEAVLV